MEITFNAGLIELNKINKYINSNYSIGSNIINKEVGLYKIFKNIVTSLNIIKKLNDQNCEIQPIATLSRMIFDNYSVLYILSSHSTDKEQLLRYYLYLLDSLNGRINSITAFSESIKNNSLIKSLDKQKEIIDHDNKAVIRITDLIKSAQLNNLVSKKTINSRNWKFITESKSNGRLSWEELYTISKIPTHFSELVQNHYSTFTHGLGMTILYEQKNSLFINATLELISSIQLNIAQIIINKLNINKKDLDINSDFNKFMEFHWNNSHKLVK